MMNVHVCLPEQRFGQLPHSFEVKSSISSRVKRIAMLILSSVGMILVLHLQKPYMMIFCAGTAMVAVRRCIQYQYRACAIGDSKANLFLNSVLQKLRSLRTGFPMAWERQQKSYPILPKLNPLFLAS